MVVVVVGPVLLPPGRASAGNGARLPPASFDARDVSRFVASEMRRSRIPAAAVAVVEGDRIVYVRGFGHAGGRPVTGRSRFRLGSSTKSFTALAVMQLVERGLVALDAPVQRYLPWFRVADARASRLITVRELLTHTSGLSHQVGLRVLGGSGRQPLAAAVRGLRHVHLTHTPGTHFAYSNTNYEVLGLLVEVVSGETFAHYLAAHVFTPLGMGDTSASDDVPLVAGSHTWFGFPVPTRSPYLRAAVPAGFVSSTAADLAHYLVLQAGDGSYRGRAVVSPAGLAALHTPAVADAQVVNGHAQDYAAGWYVGIVGGEDAIWHHGNAFISTSTIAVLRNSHAAVAVLTNEAGFGTLPSDRLAIGVIHLIRGERPATAGRDAAVTTLALDTVLLGYAVVVIEALRGAARRPGRTAASLVATIVVCGAVPAAVLLGLHAYLGPSARFAWRQFPDGTAVLGIGSILLLAAGAVRVVRVMRVMRGMRLAQASRPSSSAGTGLPK